LREEQEEHRCEIEALMKSPEIMGNKTLMKAIENNSDMIEILQGKGVETLSSANYNPFGIQKVDD
jgi:hypothetical protein